MALMADSHSRGVNRFNWALLITVLVIASLGVYNLASASRSAHAPVWVSQLTWLGIGLVIAVAILVLDYRALHTVAYPLYGVVLILLLFVLFKGRAVMGAQRWLELGPIRMQPSELAKIAVIIVLARYYGEDTNTRGHDIADLWRPGILILIPVLLTARQPDLGTALMIAAAGGSMVLFSKLTRGTLIGLGISFLALATTAWFFFLHDYQKRRVLTFLNPERDALGAGYHANQSVIAIGSGQWTGKGWGEGTQNQLSFLPEQHTDFIFSVWAEERGFVGSLILLALFLLFLVLCADVVANARDQHGAYLAMGVAAMVFWHVAVNIGMVTGLLPVVGVTLPFMSYGGSSMLTNFIGLGILLNVWMRRFMF